MDIWKSKIKIVNNNIMDSKQEIIKKIYYDPSGHGSLKTTLEDARQVDKTITINDVKEFFKNNIEKKTQLKGMNSFVAPHAYYEYQLDLFFINDLENQKNRIGMAMIDIFTKYASVVPIASKGEGDVAAGVLECLNQMGHKPEIIYSDDETSLSTVAIQKYFKDHNIDHVITRSHAWFIERFIRTFKDMLYKRIETSKEENVQWTSFIYPIMLTYNNKLKNRITKHTPAQARVQSNELNVKLSVEISKKSSRKYPLLEVGDKVNIYRKRKTGEKQQVSLWSDNAYEVSEISELHGQNYYKLNGLDKLYLRFELLKINKTRQCRRGDIL